MPPKDAAASEACKSCALSIGERCPICRQESATAVDHTFTSAVRAAVAGRRYTCNGCDRDGITAEDLASHTCAQQQQQQQQGNSQVVTRFSNFAADAGVNRQSLTFLINDLVNGARGGDLPSDEAITNAILDEAKAIRAAAIQRQQNQDDDDGDDERAAATAAASKKKNNKTKNSTVAIFMDFDQFARNKVGHITALIVGIMTRCVEKGFARNRAAVRVLAFGTPNSFRDADVLSQLTILGVEIRLVSSKKKEETDRCLERDALDDRNGADVVCVVSNDQDFVGILRRLQLAGKKVVVVHSAAANSRHARNMSVFADEAWDWTEFGIPRFAAAAAAASPAAVAAAPAQQQHQPRPDVAPAVSNNNNNNCPAAATTARVIDFGKTSAWRTDKHGMLYTFVETATAAAAGRPLLPIFLAAPRLRGSYAATTTTSSPPINVLVVAVPNPANRAQLSAVAAFPLDWEVDNVVDGSSKRPVTDLTIGDLEPTTGLAQLLVDSSSGATKTICAPPADGGVCKFGSHCHRIHRKKSRTIAPAAAAAPPPPPPAYKRGALALAPAAAVAPEATVLVEGRAMPVAALERTRFLDFARQNPGKSGSLCTHHQKGRCDRGEQCQFVHTK